MPLFLLPLIASFKSAIGAALTFISKPPVSWIAAALGLVLGLWWFGQHEFNSGVRSQLERDADAAANINAGQPKIVERLRTIYLPAEAKIKTVTQNIIKEVPVYVTKQDDARCVINNGFVRLHDSAAKGELPPGPTGDDGAASITKLSTLSETVTGNYGIANLCAVRLKEWQEWYRKNETLWNASK
jgi:hypothetical protein